MKWICRLLPLLLIAGLMLAAYLTGFYQVADFETLRYLHVEMIEYVTNHPIMTPLMFIGYCAGTTILCIPSGWMLSLLAGFLFPQPWCTLYYLGGATLGASLVFLSVKIAIGKGFNLETAVRDGEVMEDFDLESFPIGGEHSQTVKGPPIGKDSGSKDCVNSPSPTAVSRFKGKIDAHFQRYIVSYMLFIRLVPFLPFMIANLIPAFFNVRLRTYVWTTALGMLPKVLFLTAAGRGFNTVFESAEGFSKSSIFNPEVQIILLCLSLFSLLPILIRKLARKGVED